MSDFFIVDFSKYKDLWSTTGNSDVEPNRNGADLDPVDAALDAQNDEPFIPGSWRDAAFDMDVEREVRRSFVQDAAKVKKREIVHGKLEDPPIYLATDFLNQADNPARYAIQDLWPVGGNVLFAAPAKFGKSSVTMNLLRSLADGSAFLAHFDTERVAEGEGILLIDLEMNEDRVRREIREQEIHNTGCIHVAPLRGLTKHFDITTDEARKFWIKYCKQHRIRTLIIDPLAPLLGLLAIEENDNTAINIFFQQLDDFKKSAGVRDLMVTHHCGHSADWRPRGASRFNDWPDAIWLAKVDGDVTNPAAPRMFFARGRDVGDSFKGPGTLERGADKRINFKEGAAPNVSAAPGVANPARGEAEHVTHERPGLTTQQLTDELCLRLRQGDKTINKLIHEMADEGALHRHKSGTGKTSPMYWFNNANDCTYCTGLIHD